MTVDSAACNSEDVQLYSDFAPRRTRQLLFDLLSLAFVVGWVWLGSAIYALIDDLAQFGAQMEKAGAGFRETMTEVGDNLGGVPLIGSSIRTPFTRASDAGGALETAGASQQELTHQLALTVGIGVALLPILMIAAVWLATRGRFIQRAGRAKAMVRAGVGIDLLALRALSHQKIGTIAKIDPDAAGAWRRGDEAVVRRLARLELEAAGIRLPS
ncbi:hypothetical protein SAMN04489810_1751 [Microbacterium pygmaeum]|uniref:Uncharacterized protein n=1 Tax=Microbacterium pygmaeum TaxID=370764 RepID=A0A1G7YH90_9MICO|nr:hypothetical protein SAMN04489810_1751 [Microbacterium pygmaeum]